MSNSSVFKSRLKVLRSSADLQLYDSEFQTDGALTQNAFADNVSDIRWLTIKKLFGLSWLGSVVVGRRTSDRKIASSTPGRCTAG